MTLAQLTYLIALDNFRHFRKAATHCQVTQPSLSAQIRKLEEELGVILFDREKKPTMPTPIGEQVIAQARIVLAEAAAIHDLLQSATGELAGTLRVGILPTLAPYLLPRLVSCFPKRYPNVTLVFEELRTPRIIELIKRDMLDVGLIATPITSRGLVEQILFDEPLVAYVSHGHRLWQRSTLKPGDLVLNEVWLLGEGDDLRAQAVHLCGVRPPGATEQKAIQFESESLETLKRLVEQGQGMTLLPQLAVQGEVPYQPALVKPFAAPTPMRTVRMVHARALTKKHLAGALMDEIMEAVAPMSL